MNTHRDTRLSLARELRVRGQAVLNRRFGIDTRALAAFRISLGLLLLADLLLRSRHLVAFYTDVGLLPRSILFEIYPGARFSLHSVSGAIWVQAVLFTVAAGFALALLFGYRTKIVTVVSLLLLTSLHTRNPLVLNGGDVLLRRLLFWGVFLPLGQRWSIDALGDAESKQRVMNVASAALLLQVVMVYTVTGLFKLRGTRWEAGTELQYLFYVDQLTVFLGNVLVGFPDILAVLTWLWLGMVLSSMLLVVLTGRSRIMLVSLFIGMHFGMLLTMQIGIFPLVSIVALIPFLPAWVWETVDIYLYDTAKGARQILSRWDSSQILKGRRRVLRGLGLDIDLGSNQIRQVFPTGFGLRDAFGGGPKKRHLVAVVVAGLLMSSLAWNAMGLGYVATPDSLDSVRDPADHQWDMFARGQRSDGWFVVPGQLESGGSIDAYAQTSVDWDRPPDLARTYPSARWLRYSLALRGDNELLRQFAEHLCWRWNSQHEDGLVKLTIYYNKIPISLDGPGSTDRIKLLDHSC